MGCNVQASYFKRLALACTLLILLLKGMLLLGSDAEKPSTPQPKSTFEPSTCLIIYSLEEIDWGAIPKDSLVIFDIDETLVIPADAILQPTAYNQELFDRLEDLPIDELFIEMARPYNLQEVDKGWEMGAILASQSKESLIEPCSIKILNFLKLKTIKTIALTNSITGSYGSFPSFESMRVDQLRSLGIDFSTSFPNISPHRLKGFPEHKSHTGLKNSRDPVFRDGVLFTNQNSKGAVLKAFLDWISWAPKTIVFIDNSSSFLKDVQEKCQAMHIPFKGFLYRGAAAHFKKANEEMARLQLAYLKKNLIWLDDDEVQRMCIYSNPGCQK